MLASCFQPFRPQDTDLCHFAFIESSNFEGIFSFKEQHRELPSFLKFFSFDVDDLVPNARIQNGITFGAREAAEREGVRQSS